MLFEKRLLQSVINRNVVHVFHNYYPIENRSLRRFHFFCIFNSFPENIFFFTSFRSFKTNLAFVIEFCKYLDSSGKSIVATWKNPISLPKRLVYFFYSNECYRLLLRFVNWLHRDWNLSFVLWLRVLFLYPKVSLEKKSHIPM